MEERNYSKGIFYILLLTAFIAVLAVFRVTSSFFVPLILSLLLSFVFYPFIKFLTKAHIPWLLGIIIVVLIALLVFYGIGRLLVASSRAVISAYPRYEERFTTVYRSIAEIFHLPFDENSSLIANLWNSLGIRSFIQDAALTVSNFLVRFARVIVLIALFIVFFLIEIRGLKQKMKVAFPEERLNRKIMFIITKTIAEVTRFISIKFIISFLTGLLVFLLTALIRLDFAIIWGFLAFILNFIPTFGSILSWVLTVSFSLLQFYPEIWKVFYVAAVVLAINFILGNIIEPRWEGNDLGISPFLILVSLSLWGWIWGFIGMILAVPILVIIKIICENIEMLKPLAILLGSRSDGSLNYRKKRLFKK